MTETPELRRLAQDERDALKRVQHAAEFAIVGVGALAAMTVLPLGLAVLIPAGIRWRTAKEIDVQNRLIEDPPRSDFRTPTAPSFEQLYPDAVEAPRQLLGYVRSSALLCGYEQAMIRAFERILGAREQEEHQFVDERTVEWQKLGLETANALELTAEAMNVLAHLLNGREFIEAEHSLATEVEAVLRPSSFQAAFSDETAAWLFRIGATMDAFENWGIDEEIDFHFQERVFTELSRALRVSSTAKVQLANSLRSGN